MLGLVTLLWKPLFIVSWSLKGVVAIYHSKRETSEEYISLVNLHCITALDMRWSIC